MDNVRILCDLSPLAEGRELKCALSFVHGQLRQSPLAEGRELKWGTAARGGGGFRSPLAEGRELKSSVLVIVV